MKSSRVKKQSNFFRLESALFEYQFPFTAQIIPSLNFRDFQTNERHIVTFLSQTNRHKVKIKYGTDKESCLDMSDKDISYWKIYNEEEYHCIADVINCKRNERVDWLVVVGGSDLEQLNVGDIINVKSDSSRYNSLLRKSKRKLKVQVFPSGIELSLSQDLNIELKRCDPYSMQKFGKLSDVAFENDLPCLIKFCDEKEMLTSDGTKLIGMQVILLEQYTRRIIIACRKNRNDDLEVHSFPTHIELEIEILHGETPVASFTEDELRALHFNLIENNPNRAEECHQKRFLHNINLRMFEYEDVDDSDDEDVYENAPDVICEPVDDNLQRNDERERKSKDLTHHKEKYGERVFFSNTVTKNRMPSYIRENTTKLDGNFQFTLNPKDAEKEIVEFSKPNKDKQYTTLDETFEKPGYHELNEHIEFLIINENADDEGDKEMTIRAENSTYYPVPAKRKDLTEKMEALEAEDYYLELPENPSDDENASDGARKKSIELKLNDICHGEKKGSCGRSYEHPDKEGYQKINNSDLAYSPTQQCLDDCKNLYEIHYSLCPPPLPIKKKSRKSPIPAKRKDLNFNDKNNTMSNTTQEIRSIRLKQLDDRNSYLEFLPEND